MKYFVVRHIIILICIMIIPVVNIVGENLLKNPGMEEADTIIPPWSMVFFNPNISDFLIEKGNAKEGNNYLTIINRDENDARLIQRVKVQKNATYKISGWIKTEDVAEDKIGANLSLNDYWFISPDLKGTNNNWEYVAFYVTVEDDISSVDVALRLGGYGATTTGKASFDNAVMEKVNEVPAGNIHYVIEKKKKTDQQQESDVSSQKQSGEEEENRIMPETLQFIAVIIIILAGIGVFVFLLIAYKPEKGGNKQTKVQTPGKSE
jgi:ABC-type antimicrobial peptide transport system permease subunit